MWDFNITTSNFFSKHCIFFTSSIKIWFWIILYILYIVYMYKKFETIFLKFIFFQSFDILNFFLQWCNSSFQCQTNFSCSANTDILSLGFFFCKKKIWNNTFFSVNTAEKTEKSKQTKHITVYIMSDWEKTTPFSCFYSTLTIDISYSDVELL